MGNMLLVEGEWIDLSQKEREYLQRQLAEVEVTIEKRRRLVNDGTPRSTQAHQRNKNRLAQAEARKVELVAEILKL